MNADHSTELSSGLAFQGRHIRARFELEDYAAMQATGLSRGQCVDDRVGNSGEKLEEGTHRQGAHYQRRSATKFERSKQISFLSNTRPALDQTRSHQDFVH